MIVPTVGRIVWAIRPLESLDIKQPEAAQIVYVHGDRLINVAGYNSNGVPFVLTSLPLVQDDEPKPEGNFAVWMPYQKDQALKNALLDTATLANTPAPAPAAVKAAAEPAHKRHSVAPKKTD
jgi:hypothetical protein